CSPRSPRSRTPAAMPPPPGRCPCSAPRSRPRSTRRWTTNPAAAAPTAEAGCGAASASGAAEDPHQEAVVGRSQVPGAEALLEAEPGRGGVGREVVGRVAAVQAEPDHEPAVLREVLGEAGERRPALRTGEEGEHVARAELQVEAGAGAVLLLQVEGGEVPDLPARPGMIRPRHVDEVRIEIHSGHVVPGPGEVPAQAPAAAAGVEDARAAGRHRVQQTGLAVDVLAGGLEAAPALGVAVGVLGVAAQRRGPEVLGGAVGGAHACMVPWPRPARGVRPPRRAAARSPGRAAPPPAPPRGGPRARRAAPPPRRAGPGWADRRGTRGSRSSRRGPRGRRGSGPSPRRRRAPAGSPARRRDPTTPPRPAPPAGCPRRR